MCYLLLSFFGSKLTKTQGLGCECKIKSSYIKQLHKNLGQTASIEIRKCMGTYFVAVAWIFSIVKISSRLSYGNLSSQVKLHIKIWQDDLCSNMNITTIFKKGLFYSKTKYLWYDCRFNLLTPALWDLNTIKNSDWNLRKLYLCFTYKY